MMTKYVTRLTPLIFEMSARAHEFAHALLVFVLIRERLNAINIIYDTIDSMI